MRNTKNFKYEIQHNNKINGIESKTTDFKKWLKKNVFFFVKILILTIEFHWWIIVV